MPRTLFWIALTIVSVALCAQGPASRSLPKSDAERKILDTLDSIRRQGETYLSVPSEDGQMLRLMAETANARNIVEIGTSTGVSGLWFCLALEKTGGTLHTFELDSGRAAMARRHFQAAGVDRLVEITQGDAHQNLKNVKGPVDVVFIDAEKQGYVDYLNQMLPLVRPGGVILAHNVDMVRDYVAAVSKNPDLETVFYMQGGGLAVSLKKR